MIMLNTEKRNEKTMHIDTMSTAEMIKVMQEENYNALKAIDEAMPMIEKAVDAASYAVNNGGRIIYIGAGTSGRLGVLDAVECPPTFGVSPELVSGIIAGGKERMFKAGENEEDKYENGCQAVKENGVAAGDVVVGISAAGNAAYVLGAIEKARYLGCMTVGISSNEFSKLLQAVDIPIFTDTGAEVLTGSTRLKAGTAQKIVLNTLTTCAMTKTGKVYENMMINLSPSNEKLRFRVIRIVSEILNCDLKKAEMLLNENGWSIRSAVDSAKYN